MGDANTMKTDFWNALVGGVEWTGNEEMWNCGLKEQGTVECSGYLLTVLLR